MTYNKHVRGRRGRGRRRRKAKFSQELK